MAEAPTVVVGEKISATTKIWPTTGVVTYKSSDETIATVDAAGEITGVKAGKATITATMECGEKVFSRETEVTVKAVELQGVKQTTLKKIEATVKGATSDIKTSDVAVKNVTTKSDVLVKSVTTDKTDATKVMIETYVDMTNGNDIEVTVAGDTMSFKATDGTVTVLSVDPVQIPYAQRTEIEAVSKDAQGVELNRFKYNSPATGYTFTIDAGLNGYTSGSELYLNKKGDTAKATIIYTTGKYDENGKAITVEEKDIIITAVDPEVISINNISLRISDKLGVAFDDLKDGGKVAKGDNSKYAAIKIMDSNDKQITNYSDYSVETSNKDILIIQERTLSGSTAEILLAPVAEGSAAILVKDKNGNTIAALPIAVLAERKVARLDIDKSSLSLSTASNAPSGKVKLTVTDQYGETMDKAKYKTQVKAGAGTNPTSVVISSDAGDVTVNALEGVDEVTFNAAGKVIEKDTTYRYEICVGEFTRVVSIEVKKPLGTNLTYELTLSDNTMDAVVNGRDDTNKQVTVNVDELSNGVWNNDKTDEFTIQLQDASGNVVKLNGEAACVTTVSGTSIKVTETVGDLTYKLAAGTYYVVARKGTDTPITRSFVVTDSQSKVVAVRSEDTCALPASATSGASIDAQKALAVAKSFSITYLNTKNSVDNTAGANIQVLTTEDSVTTNNTFENGNVSFKEAVVSVPVENGVRFVTTVTLNSTVTVSGIRPVEQ